MGRSVPQVREVTEGNQGWESPGLSRALRGLCSPPCLAPPNLPGRRGPGQERLLSGAAEQAHARVTVRPAGAAGCGGAGLQAGTAREVRPPG